MAKIGYVRISTADGTQKTDRQDVIMKEFGVEKIFTDKATGRNTERKGLREMLSYVRDGDELYIESISRISRSTKDFLNITGDLEEKGVKLVSHKEKIDTKSPQGVFMLSVFSALSQLEVDTTRERRAEGIRIAKEKGLYTGRKPKEFDKDLFANVYNSWKAKEITAVNAMKQLDMTANRFYRNVKKYEAIAS